MSEPCNLGNLWNPFHKNVWNIQSKSCKNIYVTLMWIIMIESGHNFAHVTTAELPCHEQICDAVEPWSWKYDCNWSGWRHQMETFSAFSRVRGLLCGEFTGHRWNPLTKASDAELWCFLWSPPELSRRRLFGTPLRSLWLHCNGFGKDCNLGLIHNFFVKWALNTRRLVWTQH